MKRLKLWATALLAMSLFLAGCSSTPASKSYTAEADGMNGPVKVSVTVEDGKIGSITVDEHNETPGISDGAIEQMPQRIIEQQSLNVDVVAGATFTSNAILAATEDALTQAGLDVETFKKDVAKEEITAKEDETTDVVIVGAGISGIMAAYELKVNHPETSFILLEKLPVVGGSLATTGGAIFGTNSVIHESEGTAPSTVDMIVDFFKQTSLGEISNEQLVKNVYASSEDTLNMLYDMEAPYTGKTEKVDPSNNELMSLRMEGNGKGFYDFIKAEVVDEMPFDLRLETKVTDLIVEDGKVTGVKVEDNKNTWNIHAGQVILATGGFGSNPEMMKEINPDYADGVIATNGGATGDGFILTEQFGTKTVGEGTMGSIVAEDKSNLLTSTFLVNQEGKRFVNESAPKYVLQREVSQQTGNIAYVIADANYSDKDSLKTAMDNGLVTEYETLEELATAMGIDAEALAAQVEAYNAAVDAGNDEFGLPAEKANKIETAPFYVEKAVVRTFGTITGITVNENAQVLDGEGNVVDGLFASGELTAGNAFNIKYPGVGVGISYAANSGRLAANNAATALGK